MIEQSQRRGMRFAAAVCLTVATILVGFAHRSPPGFRSAEAMIDESGVAFGAYCVGPRVVETPAGGAPVGKTTLRVCDACLLFAAPGLGAVSEFAPIAPFGRAIDPPQRGVVAMASVAVPKARARGPPWLV